MKILRVGDPHVTVNNLEESQKLMDFIVETTKEEKVDRVEFLGDQFHTHAVVRLEVLNFWQNSLYTLSRYCDDIVVLVGNHDQPGSKEKEGMMNALSVFRTYKNVTVVETPHFLEKGMIGYIPHTSNYELFLDYAAQVYEWGAKKTIVAHQTFTGATYSNGFYAEDGIDPALIPQDNIISGHIHKTQKVGKCFYPGTPKWDNMSDANLEKGIWIFEHFSDGDIQSKRFISTEDIVTPIKKYIVTEGEVLPELKPGSRNYIELYGKNAWIKKMKEKLRGVASVKAKPTDRKQERISEGSSEDLTLRTFIIDHFKPIDSVTPEQVDTYIKKVQDGR